MSNKLLTVSNISGYLLFIAMWLAAYLFYKEYVLLVLLLFAILLCPVSIGIAYHLRKKLSVRCAFDRAQGGKEESVYVSFRVDNPSYVSSRNISLKVKMWNTYIEEEQYYYVNMPIKINGIKEARLEVKSINLGMLNCQIEEYTISDWLGIANLKTKANVQANTYIMPDIVKVSVNHEYAGSKGGMTDTFVMAIKGDDVSELNEIREYIPGDRIQNIHWKLSAKSEDFMVKDYSMPADKQITVLFDLKKGMTDDVVELGIGVVRYLCDKRQTMNVSWYAMGGLVEEYVTSAEDIQGIIHRMYEAEPLQQSLKTSDYFINMHPGGYGKCLYICDKESMPSTENGKAEAVYKEAVAVWL